jgi:triosephosphate isomerase
VIVGHSERRRDAGETDAIVNAKVKRALDAGLRTIVCIGEQLEEREAGRAEAVVVGQVRGCLDAVELSAERAREGTWLTIAYEPVWAIGTGRTARGADAARMADVIRSAIGATGAGIDPALVPVLYGGSVTSAAIDEFLAEPSIDGALVGGASLKADEMAGIVARAALTARARQG